MTMAIVFMTMMMTVIVRVTMMMVRTMAMTAANIIMMKLLKPANTENHITVACDRQRGSKTARGRESERAREKKS